MYKIIVTYLGYTGKEYKEELNFVNESQAIKVYDIFSNDKSGNIKSIEFKNIK